MAENTAQQIATASAEAVVAPSTKAETSEVAQPQSPQAESGHKLHSEWSFWFDKRPKGQFNYTDILVNLGSFDTVESFWGLYRYLQRPSKLSKGCAYRLFRSPKPPMWESYPNGGYLSVRLKKKSEFLDRMWEQLVFAMITEEFQEPGHVVGVAVKCKAKEDVLALWYTDASNQAMKAKIAETLKLVLQHPSSLVVEQRANSAAIAEWQDAKATGQETSGYESTGQQEAKKKKKKKNKNKNNNNNNAQNGNENNSNDNKQQQHQNNDNKDEQQHSNKRKSSKKGQNHQQHANNENHNNNEHNNNNNNNNNAGKKPHNKVMHSGRDRKASTASTGSGKHPIYQKKQQNQQQDASATVATTAATTPAAEPAKQE